MKILSFLELQETTLNLETYSSNLEMDKAFNLLVRDDKCDDHLYETWKCKV